MQTKITGRQDEAQAIARLLDHAGIKPWESTVLGAFVHLTYRSDDSCRKAASVMAQGGFRVVGDIRRRMVNNVGQLGWGASSHDEYRISFQPA